VRAIGGCSSCITNADVSDTLTASDLVAVSSVVSDSEVDNDITITSTKNITTNKDVIPSSDKAGNIGRSILRWLKGWFEDIFVSGKITSDDTIFLDDSVNVSGTLKVNTYALENGTGFDALYGRWEPDTDTTYSAGNGISLSDTTFSVVAGDGLTQEASGLKVTVDGIGDTQLEYDTGQHLTTTSNPQFNNITSINCITFDSGGVICSGA